MPLQRMIDLHGPRTRDDTRSGMPRRWVGVVASAFTVLSLAGCATGGASSGTASQQSGPPVATGAARTGAAPTGALSTAAPSAASSATADQSPGDDIPPGRGIAEGGGGPLSYTFREEWRRARAEAQKWRAGAYLITAAGDFVNDDGVPNHWSLDFIDKTAADAVLMVEVDPWGKVTATREVTGGGVGSFVGQYTKRIPYAVIDSDKAVGLGKAALAARYNLAKTKDPRIGLNFSLLDGSGPYWTYTLFNNSTAEYVTAQIDALTGVVTPLT